MSSYIPPYGSGVLAYAPVPPNPTIRSIVIGQLEAADRYNAAAPVTQLKVNGFSPPAGSVRREYIVSDDQTFAVGNTVRINLVLSGADALYLDELAVMFRDENDADREALIDADTDHNRLKAANQQLLISVGWQVVDGVAIAPTVTVHPWTFASAADVMAALTGTEPTGKGGHVITLQSIYDTRATIVQTTPDWTELVAGKVERASQDEAEHTAGHSNEKGLSVLRGWQQTVAWWAALSGTTLFNKIAKTTEEQAIAGADNAGVMTALRTREHFNARKASAAVIAAGTNDTLYATAPGVLASIRRNALSGPKVILQNTASNYATGGTGPQQGLTFPGDAVTDQWLDSAKIEVKSFSPLGGCSKVRGGIYFDWDDVTIASVEAIFTVNWHDDSGELDDNPSPETSVASSSDFMEESDWIPVSAAQAQTSGTFDALVFRSKAVTVPRNGYLLFTRLGTTDMRNFSVEMEVLQINAA